jgi:hypothetical protein
MTALQKLPKQAKPKENSYRGGEKERQEKD